MPDGKGSGKSERRARILITDDDALVRIWIHGVLSSEDALEVIGEATNGREALALCARTRPDLVLMDVSMPEMNGIEATREIKARFPKTAVLVLTSNEDEAAMKGAVKAGAAGYVLKDGTRQNLTNAVHRCLNGESPLNQELAMKLLKSMTEEMEAEADSPSMGPVGPTPVVDGTPPPNPLTPRESEVLALLATGKTNKELASELHLSISTVKRHVEHIISKLEVSDRTQAAVKAVALGLVSGQKG